MVGSRGGVKCLVATKWREASGLRVDMAVGNARAAYIDCVHAFGTMRESMHAAEAARRHRGEDGGVRRPACRTDRALWMTYGRAMD